MQRSPIYRAVVTVPYIAQVNSRKPGFNCGFKERSVQVSKSIFEISKNLSLLASYDTTSEKGHLQALSDIVRQKVCWSLISQCILRTPTTSYSVNALWPTRLGNANH